MREYAGAREMRRSRQVTPVSGREGQRACGVREHALAITSALTSMPEGPHA